MPFIHRELISTKGYQVVSVPRISHFGVIHMIYEWFFNQGIQKSRSSLTHCACKTTTLGLALRFGNVYIDDCALS